MSRRGWLPLLMAVLVLHLALILPAGAGTIPLQTAPELPVLVLAAACLGMAGRLLVTALLSLLVLQKIADLAMLQALGRPFNPVADLPLINAGLRVIAGSFGVAASVAVTLGALVVLTVVLILLWWACGVAGRLSRQGKRTLAGLSAVVVALGAAGILDATNSAYALGRIELARDTAANLRQLRIASAMDPFAGAPDLLNAIDRDVLVIFVESYGRTSFDTPEYAGRHLQTLREMERQLAHAGLSMRSGFLTAPTQGGQSWLSHATFANGLWISDQASYGAVLASGREGLFHHARRAGFRTAAVMPAITRPWPEAQAMGFDRVLGAAELGYRGKPFNWVTMPDQFTLAALDRLLRNEPERPRLFLQVALISSHAPWVPVPRLLDWDELGDGSVFDAMAAAGDPPEVVWRDPERVRRQYRAAIDYSLRVVMDHARRHAGDPPLMIVLGDHQTAPGIALDRRPDVPIHLIGPAALVERSAAWGLTPGLVPARDAGALPMDRMRDLILRGFSDGRPQS